MNKTESIRNMNRILKDNYQNTVPDIEIGVIVCAGTDQDFGKLLLFNTKMKDITGFQSSDLRHQSIETFIPMPLKSWHNKFVEDFNQTGQNCILNKI